MRRFRGKIAIVTGGSRGIGREITHRLASEGAAVLITGRTKSDLESAAAAFRAEGLHVWSTVGDVADPATIDPTVDAAIGRWGRVDVLVNNAGLGDDTAFLEIAQEKWDYVLDVVLNGPFLLSQRVAREMAKRGSGVIINIASIDAHGADGPFASYGAAKAGLRTLTKYMAVELAGHGIRCNSISPGWVETQLVKSSTTPEMLERMKFAFHRVPLGRLLKAEEIAAACAFLASDEASGITGTDLVVDGGTCADLYIHQTLEDPEHHKPSTSPVDTTKG